MDLLLRNLLRYSNRFKRHSLRVISNTLLITLFFLNANPYLQSQTPCENFAIKIEKVEALEMEQQFSEAFEFLLGFEEVLAQNGCWEEWYQTIRKQFLISRKYFQYARIDTVLENNLALEQWAPPEFQAKFNFLASYIYNKRGQVYKSIDFAEKALKLYDRLGIQDQKISILQNLANSHSNFNDHQSAIQYGKILLRNIESSDFIQLTRSHNFLATYFYHVEDYQNALLHSDSALLFLNLVEPSKQKFHDSEYLKIKLDQVKLYTLIGEDNKGDTILKQLTKKFKDSEKIIETRIFLLEKKKNFKLALKLKESLNIDYELEIENRDKAKTMQSYANTLFLNGHLDQALEISHDVVKYFSENFINPNVLSNPRKSQIVPEAWLTEAFFLKAKVLIKKMDQDSELNISPELVFQNFDLAIETLNLLRGFFQEVNSRLDMSENMIELFSNAIDFSMSQFTKTNQIEYFNKAINYSQTAKSFTLKHSILTRQEFENANVPKPLTEKYYKLIHKSYDQNDNYIAIRDSISSIEKKIRDKYFNTSKVEFGKVLGSQDYQKYIDNETAIIDYFFYKKILYTFLITKKETFLFKKKTNKLEPSINQYLQLLHQPYQYNHDSLSIDNYFDLHAATIRNYLISDISEILIKNKINHLAICAMGILKKISFANLPSAEGSSWRNIKNALVYNYVIQNLNTLDEIKSEGKTAYIKKSTIIGLDYTELDYSKAPKLKHLPFAIEEANYIKENIGGNKFLNQRASLKNIERTFKESDHIHFSGHCIVDNSNYEMSYIPLYDEENGITKLDFNMLQSYNIHPDLVVLSACNTNNGVSLNSEGTLSMARVFTETGARSVISSNWNTPDETSYKIIKEVYNFIDDGFSKAEAIRKAQIKYATDDSLSQPSERTPSFWSNWVFTGEDRKLQFKSSFLTTNWISTILLITIILIGILLYRRKISIHS